MSTASRAYRFYLLGRRWLKDPSCEPGGLEELLARSLDLDPGFAPAWELAARFQHRLGRACMFGRAHLEEALTAAEQAATLDPASPSAQLLVGRLQLELGDPLGAYRRARNVREGFPQLPSAACLELRTLTYLGHPQAAEEARARCFAAAGGGDLGDDGVAPEISLYLGEPERFLAEMRAAPGLRARYSRGQALLLAGDEAAAEAQLAPLFSAAPGQLWARLAQALLAVVQDKPQEAIQVATVLARNATAVGLQDGEVSYRIAQVLALAGDADGALDMLGTAVAQGFVCAACFRADRSLIELRNHPAFGSLVLAAEQRITPISLHDNAGGSQRGRPMAIESASGRRRVQLFARMDVVTLSVDDIVAAIDLHRLHGFSIWDALIVRAALISGCRVLYTEDMQDGGRIDGLQIVNPFAQ
jgi:hypothetical protein